MKSVETFRCRVVGCWTFGRSKQASAIRPRWVLTVLSVLFAAASLAQDPPSGTVHVYPASAKQVGQVVITVRSFSEVTGDRIILGDVADVQAEPKAAERIRRVFLGETPIIGLRRLITRQILIARLLAAGEKASSFALVVPDGAVCSRKGQTVRSTQIADAARSYVIKQLGAEIELLEKDPVRDCQAPTGEVSIAPIALAYSTPTFSVTLSIRIDGKQVSTRIVKLLADASQGVRQGQDVKLRIRSGGALVELTGKAKANALIGQTVEVATDRKTTHMGKVVAPGVVEVSI